MWMYIIVGLAALVASGITVFTGFGLGTMLLPVFALFFPKLAVQSVAIVHGAGNTLKLPLFGKKARWDVVLKFGVPAVLSAVVGAFILNQLIDLKPIYTYRLFGAEKQVTPLKLVMGVLIFCFAWLDLLPRFRKMEIDTKWLPLGGVISGFFGGLSGHQGAARTAFLVKTGMSTPQFVGTTAVVGFGVDMIRLSVYAWGFFVSREVDTTNLAGAMKLAAVATVFGFIGLLISRLFLKKVTMKAVQTLAGILLLVVSVVLVTGVV